MTFVSGMVDEHVTIVAQTQQADFRERGGPSCELLVAYSSLSTSPLCVSEGRLEDSVMVFLLYAESLRSCVSTSRA